LAWGLLFFVAAARLGARSSHHQQQITQTFKTHVQTKTLIFDPYFGRGGLQLGLSYRKNIRAAGNPSHCGGCSGGNPAPTIEDRVKGLEAYVNNGDPTGSSLVGASGPGHNAWMMTSSAFVLFMTLPGLALFYGGLVRAKNVLSILAMCFGITGLVTILWWAVGYSLVFWNELRKPLLWRE
jgi:Ammonia permease